MGEGGGGGGRRGGVTIATFLLAGGWAYILHLGGGSVGFYDMINLLQVLKSCCTEQQFHPCLQAGYNYNQWYQQYGAAYGHAPSAATQ